MLGVLAISLAVLAYVYVAYPVLIGLLAAALGRPVRAGDARPTVSIIVAAHQESAVIADKVSNFLKIDYPADRLEMIIVSDGSTDGTDEIVAGLAAPRVRLLRQEPRQGKAAALGRAIAVSGADVLLFTDANVLFDPTAVALLVRPFADPDVGVVTGTVQLIDRKLGYAQSEGAYYRYERFLQRSESAFASVVGVDGALYAARRALVAPPPPEAILDDFIISLEIARRGPRIIYEPEALAYEDAAPGMADEFRRKTRVAVGAFQSIVRRWGLPGLAAPRLLFCYLSHKALRWLSPWFMLAALVSSVPVALQGGVLAVPLAAQALAYSLAVIGLLAPATRGSRAVAVPMYFLLMNAALALGLIRLISGSGSVRWKPVPRTRVELPEASGGRG